MENQENKNSLDCNTIELDSWDKKTGRKHIKSIQPVNPLGLVYLFGVICSFASAKFLGCDFFILGLGVGIVIALIITLLLNKSIGL